MSKQHARFIFRFSKRFVLIILARIIPGHPCEALSRAAPYQTPHKQARRCQSCLFCRYLTKRFSEWCGTRDREPVKSSEEQVLGNLSPCRIEDFFFFVFLPTRTSRYKPSLNDSAVSLAWVFPSQGKEQVSVIVSDEGGGMGLATTRNAFRYLWTSSGESTPLLPTM